MAQHIDNVVARNYVMVCGPSEKGSKEAGPRIQSKGKGKGKTREGDRPKSRHMVPTGLGLAILDMFFRLVPEVCEPDVRAYMEKQVLRARHCDEVEFRMQGLISTAEPGFRMVVVRARVSDGTAEPELF